MSSNSDKKESGFDASLKGEQTWPPKLTFVKKDSFLSLVVVNKETGEVSLNENKPETS